MGSIRHAVAVCVVAAGVATVPAAASAAPVLVLEHGRVHVENDRFAGPDLPPPPPAPAGRAAATRKRPASQAGATRTALKHLRDRGALSAADYDRRLGAYDDAVATSRSLHGRRRNELRWVIANTDEMAATGRLTAARIVPAFLVLTRNREYWSSGAPIPAGGERVKFYGSLVLFQYYPGEGLQFQALANWGKLNGYLNGGFLNSAHYLIRELIPLGVRRDGGIVWEYYFHYGGGHPPWTSSISQGTAIQALVHAAAALDHPYYRTLAIDGLRTFELNSPRGVRKRMGRGRVHYLIYSFAPRYYVLNAFIQALNGLFDVGSPQLGNSARARSLFGVGDREARREVPRFDTGHWSRYSLSGELSTLGYHVLLRDFLRNLCDRTHTRVYCKYAQKFTRYLR